MEKRIEQVRAEHFPVALSYGELRRMESDCEPVLKALAGATVAFESTKQEFETRTKPQREQAIGVLKRSRSSNSRARAIVQEDSLKRMQASYERTRAWLAEYEKYVKENEQWCRDIKDMLDKIHKDGRLHFRAFVVHDGYEFEVVRSE